MSLSRIYQSKLVRALLPAFAGFIGYGGWGFLCNFRHGLGMGVQSGLVQGSLSFAITLVSNLLMETIYRICKGRLITILITSLLIVGTSYSVNALAGTPEIIWTIAPGSIMGIFYVSSYVSALHRAAQSKK